LTDPPRTHIGARLAPPRCLGDYYRAWLRLSPYNFGTNLRYQWPPRV